MAVGYGNGDVYLWDTESKQTDATITPPADSQARALVAFGPGGTTLAVGYDNGDVRLLGHRDGQVHRHLLREHG